MNVSLLIGQTGGPTAVINASLAGIVMEAKTQGAFAGIYGMRHGLEGFLKGQLIDLGYISDDTIRRLVDTPAAALGSSRDVLQAADYPHFLSLLKAHNTQALILTGGNGTMAMCQQIVEYAKSEGYDLGVIGIPKTMDNDLVGTDHSPGYGSAARFIAMATRDTGLDLESMATYDDVVMMEVMGRNAGWVAAAAALAKTDESDAPHLIYLPEVPFSEEKFLDDVTRVHSQLGRVFVVVEEGIRDESGQLVARHQGFRDPMGRVIPAVSPGVGAYLTELVQDKLELWCRPQRPGLIGRALSACVSEVDRQEALALGREAVRRLIAGESGKMLTLKRVSNTPYTCEIGAIALDEVASAEKLLPDDFIDASGVMVTQAFCEYALPLIGDLPPVARLKFRV